MKYFCKDGLIVTGLLTASEMKCPRRSDITCVSVLGCRSGFAMDFGACFVGCRASPARTEWSAITWNSSDSPRVVPLTALVMSSPCSRRRPRTLVIVEVRSVDVVYWQHRRRPIDSHRVNSIYWRDESGDDVAQLLSCTDTRWMPQGCCCWALHLRLYHYIFCTREPIPTATNVVVVVVVVVVVGVLVVIRFSSP